MDVIVTLEALADKHEQMAQLPIDIAMRNDYAEIAIALRKAICMITGEGL